MPEWARRSYKLNTGGLSMASEGRVPLLYVPSRLTPQMVQLVTLLLQNDIPNEVSGMRKGGTPWWPALAHTGIPIW